MNGIDITQLVLNIGFPAAIAIYALNRLERMSKEYVESVKEMNEKYITVIKDVNSTLTENNHILQEVQKTLEKLNNKI